MSSSSESYMQTFVNAPAQSIPYPAKITGSRALLGALIGSIASKKGARIRGAGKGLLIGGAIGGLDTLEWLLRKKRYEQDMMQAMKMGSRDNIAKIAALSPGARRELVIKVSAYHSEGRSPGMTKAAMAREQFLKMSDMIADRRTRMERDLAKPSPEVAGGHIAPAIVLPLAGFAAGSTPPPWYKFIPNRSDPSGLTGVWTHKGKIWNSRKNALIGTAIGATLGGAALIEWLVRKKKWELEHGKVAELTNRRDLVVKSASILKESGRFGRFALLAGLAASPLAVWDYMRAREKGFRQGTQTAIAQMAPVLAASNLPQGAWSSQQAPSGIA